MVLYLQLPEQLLCDNRTLLWQIILWSEGMF